MIDAAMKVFTYLALLFTIIVMFSFKGEYIDQLPFHVLLIAVPLTLYFFITWFSTFFIAYGLKAEYQKATAVSFTAASNDFELAITVAMAIRSVTNDQA